MNRTAFLIGLFLAGWCVSCAHVRKDGGPHAEADIGAIAPPGSRVYMLFDKNAALGKTLVEIKRSLAEQHLGPVDAKLVSMGWIPFRQSEKVLGARIVEIDLKDGGEWFAVYLQTKVPGTPPITQPWESIGQWFLNNKDDDFFSLARIEASVVTAGARK